jgi:hypothetical protein
LFANQKPQDSIGTYIEDFKTVTKAVLEIIPAGESHAYLRQTMRSVVATLEAPPILAPLQERTWQDEQERIEALRTKYPDQIFSLAAVPLSEVTQLNESIKAQATPDALRTYSRIAGDVLGLRSLPETSRLPIATVRAMAEQWLADHQQTSP